MDNIEKYQVSADSRQKTRSITPFLTAILFVVIVGATLSAGLWPFSAPPNEVQWVPGEDALQFGRHGTALSDGVLKFPGSTSGACTIEIWLRPATTWTRGNVVAFYNSQHNRPFEVKQEYADLVLELSDGTHVSSASQHSLWVSGVFLKREFVVAIASDGQKTSVYVDGQLVSTSSDFALSSDDLSGQVILANAPLRNDGWRGTIKGLAVYGTDLSSNAVLRSEREWRERAQPLATAPDDLIALYLFRQHEGRTVRNEVASGSNLQIPGRYTTVDQLRFENPVSEYREDGSYAEDVIVNVLGFIPLGFLAVLFFSNFLGPKQAGIAAVLAGTATSLAIEYFQSFLPTRYSGISDLVTNTLGTAIGVFACHIAFRFAKKIWAEHFHAQPR